MHKQPFIQTVEAARGLAAIEVLAYHVVEIFNLHQFSQLKYLLYPFSFGHEAVIFFFVLSGFSIHYNYAAKNFRQRSEIKSYYFARWLRLYPLLIGALLLTLVLVLVGHSLSVTSYTGLWNSSFINSIIGSSLLAVDLRTHSGYWIATPRTNPPIWSLSYEAIYYLIYPMLWWLNSRLSIISVTIIAGLISIIALVITNYLGANHLANVLAYYLIWVLGALLAHVRLHTIRAQNYNPILIWVVVILLLLKVMLRDQSTILGDYLLGFAIVAAAYIYYSKTPLWKTKTLSLSMYCTTFIGFALFLQHYSGISYSGSLLLLQVKIILIAVVFILFHNRAHFNRLINVMTDRFLVTGSVSYGIYIFHYPLLVAAKAYLTESLGIPVSIVVGLSFVISVAYVMERVAYPKLKSLLVK